jgi:flagellar hook-associated protein 3 FlgL
MFDRAISQMGLTQDRLSKAQMQLTTGKELLKPSDAPEQSVNINRLKSAIDRQKSYLDTIRTVQDKMRQQETAADKASDVITRLKELTVQAANDTYSPQDRKLIDIEVRELRDQLLSLANTQDVNGNYIFSGARTAKAAFTVDMNGHASYQGDQTVNPGSVGDQRSVQINRAGTNPFGMVVRTITGDHSSPAMPQKSLLGNFSDTKTNISNQDFTLTITTGNGAKTVTIPATDSSPQDIVDAINNQLANGVKATLYPSTDGNAYQILLTGQTGGAHDFSVSSTAPGGLNLTTLQQASNAVGDENRVGIGFFEVIESLSAALQNNDAKGIQRAVGEVGSLQDNMTESLARIGASMNTLESQQSLAEEAQLRLEKMRSDVEDVDYQAAITKMNKDMLALQAGQSAFAQIAKMTLWDYVR